MVCVISVQVMLTWSNRSCTTDTSSKGTHFMVGIQGSYRNPNNIQLILTTSDDTVARVTAPFVNYDKQFTFSKHLTIQLDVRLAQLTNDTQFKGIEIESDKPMSVVVMNGVGDNQEGFLALPITPVSTEFVVASYSRYEYGTTYYYSTFVIAGVYPDTFIDYELPASYKADSKFSGKSRIELQPFETFQFHGIYDLTGTIIRSSKPVSVFSGSTGSMIPAKTGGNQYIVEQMVPTAYWDLTYIIPPIYPRHQFMVRIFARENNTEVAIYNGTNHEKRYVDALGYTEYISDRKPSFIFADKPINVVKYGYDKISEVGDPFLSNGQAVYQHQSRYEFSVQGYTKQNTLAVSVKTVDLPGLKLDGKKDAIQSAPTIDVQSPVENYTTVFLSVLYNSYHVIEHERGQPFGAMIYGLQDTATAYGYPLQLHLRDTDCKQNGTNVQQQKKSPPQCFSCDDMTSLKYCDKVTTCASTNQVCYVQKYQKSGGVHRYRSGCRVERNCNFSLPGECIECCEGDFCNSYGCGDDGVQGLQKRGPFCFDCRHHGEHEACETVQLCASGELCKVERYRWGDIDMHYVKGCADARMCSGGGRREVDHIQARSIPVCSTCCTKDFCNKNCTAIPSIVG